ncbi:MAG TPA: methyltransferase domain-containing protein [Abditibacteriaceae bacterium]
MKRKIQWVLITASSAAFCLWVTSNARVAPVAIADVAAKPKPVSDSVPRQVARPWTGSATEFEYPGRDKTLQIEYVMDAMSLKPGSVVADIGAGGGWFSVRAARRVGPAGLVYANEILPKYTDFIERRAQKEGLKNIRTVLGTTSDPKLPAGTMDAVLILNAYHEFDKPLNMLQKIKASMKVGGRLAFIERDDYKLRSEARKAYAATGKIKRRVDERPDKDPFTDDHRLAREVVEREAAAVGLRKVIVNDLRDDHYVLIVTRDK